VTQHTSSSCADLAEYGNRGDAMVIFVAWIIFAVLVGVYAEKKGRSGPGFFFLSLLLSPLIGFLIAIVSSPIREKVAQQSGLKKCPDCAEYVQQDAWVCRFCKHHFTSVGGIVWKE
jgi:hypothetical protein